MYDSGVLHPSVDNKLRADRRVLIRCVDEVVRLNDLVGVQGDQVRHFVGDGFGEVDRVGGIENIHAQFPAGVIGVIHLADPGKGVVGSVCENDIIRDPFPLFGGDEGGEVIPDTLVRSSILLVGFVFRWHPQDVGFRNLVAIHFVGDQVEVRVRIRVIPADFIQRAGCQFLVDALQAGVQARIVRADDGSGRDARDIWRG